MTEEIKEILHLLKRCDNTYLKIENSNGEKEYEYHQVNDLRLDGYHSQLLLDYITNLQQENKAKTHQIEVLEEIVNYERNIRNDKLQQENEKLKYNARGQVNDYFKDKYADEVLKNAKLKEENETLKAKLEIGKTCGFCPYYDYKSKCKKAIEYINKQKKKMYKSRNKIALFILMKLENILNGSDENETNS